jgi:hypothetical protein
MHWKEIVHRRRSLPRNAVVLGKDAEIATGCFNPAVTEWVQFSRAPFAGAAPIAVGA